MGAGPPVDVCGSCRLLFRPGFAADGCCPICRSGLQRSTDAVEVRDGRLVVRLSGYKVAPRHLQKPTGTRHDDKTRRAAVSPTQRRRAAEQPGRVIQPLERQDPFGSDSDSDSSGSSDTLPVIGQDRRRKPTEAISADDALRALTSSEPLSRSEDVADSGFGDDVDSGFIPLDSIDAGRSAPPARPEPPATRRDRTRPANLRRDTEPESVRDPKKPAKTTGGRKTFDKPVEFGDYELLGILGRGGMGVVYRAREVGLDRLVALKVMSLADISEEDRIRFEREAKAAARLRHPNIVRLFRRGKHLGHHFFTLELVEGENLHDIATRNRGMEPRQALTLAAKIARAMAYAHAEGVIHRDLKPQNILIDSSGEPHVTDFGLAKDLEDAINLTTQGVALGSPPYMPPEQAMGRYDRVDQQSDVYGIGAILYECLTGQPPFTGQTVYEIIAKVQSEEPRRPRDLVEGLDSDIETICLKALDKTKSDRYESAESLARDIDRYLAGDPIHARPPTLTVRVARQVTKYRFQFASAALSLATVLSAIIYGVSLSWTRELPNNPAEAIVVADARGSRVERALGALGGGRFEDASRLLGESLRACSYDDSRAAGLEVPKPRDREAWRKTLEDAVGRLREIDEGPARRWISIALAGPSDSPFDPGALGLALQRVMDELTPERANGLQRFAPRVLEAVVAEGRSPPEDEPARAPSLLDQVRALPSVRGLRADGLAEARRAVRLLPVVAMAARIQAERGRGAPDPERQSEWLASIRARSTRLILEDAPAEARHALALQRFRAEGGPRRKAGRAFLETLAARGHKELAALLESGLPPPAIDPGSGRLCALDPELSTNRWTFPPTAEKLERRPVDPFDLSGLEPGERLPSVSRPASAAERDRRSAALARSVRAFREAGSAVLDRALLEAFRREGSLWLRSEARAILDEIGAAARPTAPLLGPDGERVHIGWLSRVYSLDRRTGHPRARFRLPGRVMALRREAPGVLIVTVQRPHGVEGRSDVVADLRLELDSGKLTHMDGRTPHAVEFVHSNPELARSLRLEAELLLGVPEIVAELQAAVREAREAMSASSESPNEARVGLARNLLIWLNNEGDPAYTRIHRTFRDRLKALVAEARALGEDALAARLAKGYTRTKPNPLLMLGWLAGDTAWLDGKPPLKPRPPSPSGSEFPKELAETAVDRNRILDADLWAAFLRDRLLARQRRLLDEALVRWREAGLLPILTGQPEVQSVFARALQATDRGHKVKSLLAKAIKRAEASPRELITVAVELDRDSFRCEAFESAVSPMLQRALAIATDMGYRPGLAGYGPLDPGARLQEALLGTYDRQLIVRDRAIRRIKELGGEDLKQARTATAERSKEAEAWLKRQAWRLEGWRDLFAPALAASWTAGRLRHMRFAPKAPPGVEGPPPITAPAGAPDSGFAGIGPKTMLAFAVATHWTTNFLISLAALTAGLLYLKAHRNQAVDLELVGIVGWQDRVRSWFERPLLRLQYSLWSYITLRDRVAVLMLLVTVYGMLSFQETLLEALAARERAAPALFAGLPGHPTALTWLVEGHPGDAAAPDSEDALIRDANRAALLADGLAGIGERRLASALSRRLAERSPDPHAWNNAVDEVGDTPEGRERIKAQLDGLLDRSWPERAWARWILSDPPNQDYASRDEAMRRDPTRFRPLSELGDRAIPRVTPRARSRDALVLGRRFWWTGIPGHFVNLLLGRQNPAELESRVKLVLGSVRAPSAEKLLDLRLSGLWRLNAVVLLLGASVLIPYRSNRLRTEDVLNPVTHKVEWIFPGVTQFMRGFTPSGVALATLFVFCAHIVIYGPRVPVISFDRLMLLSGSLPPASLFLVTWAKLWTGVTLVALFGLHWLQFSRILALEEQRAVRARSSRVALESEVLPALVEG